MTSPNPNALAGFVPISVIGSLATIKRWRRVGLLPAPFIIDKHRVYTEAQVAEFRRLRQLGEDRWMTTNHGRGRPAMNDVAALALAA